MSTKYFKNQTDSKKEIKKLLKKKDLTTENKKDILNNSNLSNKDYKKEIKKLNK